MKLQLICPGKTSEAYLSAGIDDFCKRINRYASISIHCLKTRRYGAKESSKKIKVEEAELLLARLSKQTFSIALDLSGREVDSVEFSRLLTLWEDQGRREVSFLVGGPFGLASSVVDRADCVLSLSRMTFTHEMVRLILLEQIYRAYSIKAGTGYHK